MAMSTADTRSTAVNRLMKNLYDVPPTDVTYEGYRMVTISPITTGITPMEFVIPALDDFVDLNRSYFTIKLRLKTTKDANLAAANQLYVTPNLAHNLFKQINVRLNGTLISPQTDTYAYKAFFETLLNYDRDDGETILKPQGWINGVGNYVVNLRATDVDGISGETFTSLPKPQQDAITTLINETRKYTDGKEKVLMFKPSLDIFHSSKPIVPRVEIKMRFFFNSPDFFTWGVPLSGGANFLRLKPEDIDMKFHLCQLRLNASDYRNITDEIQRLRQWVPYPLVRSEIRTFSFDGSSTYWEENNLFQGRIPDRLIVGILDSKAFNGDVEYYPFCFQKKGVIRIKQIIKGEEYPYETLELDGATNEKDNAGYFRFLQASGALIRSKGGMLTKSEWGQGKSGTLFMFNNVPSGNANTKLLNPKQAGTTELKIWFESNPGNITVVVFAEFEDILNIDPNGSVIYNIYE